MFDYHISIKKPKFFSNFAVTNQYNDMRQTGNRNDEHRYRRPDNIRTYTVAEPSTLLAAVSKILSDHTPTKVKSMLKHNQFAVNGMPCSQFDRSLNSGDEIAINFDRAFAVFKHPRIQLVYEDDDILVVNKGYGVLSMGTDQVKEGTVYSEMRKYVKAHNPKAQVFIVHRLDRDTSGLMMLAKSRIAKDNLQHNWNNMVLNRKYVAVLEGELEGDRQGAVRSYLAENSKFEVYSTDDPSKGQPAVTRYSILARRKGHTLVELELDTGRKNQIRVHMKDLGHPIVGDRKYGAGHSPISRLALHALTLRFVHPITRQVMNFETPIPTKFQSLLK